MAAAVAALVALVTVVSILVGRRTARHRVDELLPRHEDVMAKRRLTDTAARNLPEHSPYTPPALSDHERYRAELTQAEELHEQLPLPRDRGWGWGLRGSQRRLARDCQATVAELDELTEQLSDAVVELRDQQVSILAEDEKEADLLRGVDVDPVDSGTQEYRSLRERRHALEFDGGSSGTFWHLSPVLWYSMWSTESHSQLESHRNPSADSSSTSGFSSGGFSGAGSSSRF